MSAQPVREKGDSIRSVERAIEVLQALNRRPLSTLHDLYRETGIPKPSIVRVLRTLEAKGLAAQASAFGTYQLLGRVKSLASGFHHEPQIVEIAQQRLIEFTCKEGWPLSLALFDVDAMVVRACTIRFTALSLEHTAIGRRLSLLTHAMGRAYLAFSGENERAILLAILRGQASGHAPVPPDEQIARMIGQIRDQGFALRDPLANPRSSTMAVPVFDNGRVVATLGFTWIAAAMTVQDARARYLARLQALTAEIGAALEADRIASPPLRQHSRSVPADDWAWGAEPIEQPTEIRSCVPSLP